MNSVKADFVPDMASDSEAIPPNFKRLQRRALGEKDACKLARAPQMNACLSMLVVASLQAASPTTTHPSFLFALPGRNEVIDRSAAQGARTARERSKAKQGMKKSSLGCLKVVVRPS
jgi:hypothetical protein